MEFKHQINIQLAELKQMLDTRERSEVKLPKALGVELGKFKENKYWKGNGQLSAKGVQLRKTITNDIYRCKYVKS